MPDTIPPAKPANDLAPRSRLDEVREILLEGLAAVEDGELAAAAKAAPPKRRRRA